LQCGNIFIAKSGFFYALHSDCTKNAGANDFYEHGKQYDTLTPEQAIHNPSSYVSFAEHIFYRKDERFGAGRPNE